MDNWMSWGVEEFSDMLFEMMMKLMDLWRVPICINVFVDRFLKSVLF
jgi:hypothetical protein